MTPTTMSVCYRHRVRYPGRMRLLVGLLATVLGCGGTAFTTAVANDGGGIASDAAIRAPGQDAALEDAAIDAPLAETGPPIDSAPPEAACVPVTQGEVCIGTCGQFPNGCGGYWDCGCGVDAAGGGTDAEGDAPLGNPPCLNGQCCPGTDAWGCDEAVSPPILACCTQSDIQNGFCYPVLSSGTCS